ncbi:hypothetical protein WN48_02363 [Eufriesea mexicana]|uniref:uncharacterized protein LOC108548918 n=1 Tax=Eufriesea mexicana TaxID=516756 RepID=UPI00083BF9E5|nr:PREDICTED: uncharacterized protein LOC108548918 [Eufriesea mexicana]OAD56838.1 hypothetical protein WN48_02363 [Eufriesea mexicana]
MRDSFKSTVTLLICLLLHCSESKDSSNGKTKASRGHGKAYGKYPGGGLISFNTEQEKLDIDWSVTIPFISIPLEHKIGENGEVSPWLNVNTKALGVVGLITTLFSVVTPLFSKTHPQYNYRSMDNEQWLQMGDTINEMIFGNNYVAPCMQRVVCSIVSVATQSENPTSADKIIDGLSSHRWFKDVTNGTIIQDAVLTGRKGDHDCAYIYKDCSITPQFLKTIMNEFGIV